MMSRLFYLITARLIIKHTYTNKHNANTSMHCSSASRRNNNNSFLMLFHMKTDIYSQLSLKGKDPWSLLGLFKISSSNILNLSVSSTFYEVLALKATV